ncbi:cytochrome P450 [Dankookia sp. GCM10030260]|uniref:cytochrome P450 n=1 Tax=Dankookia sp. GCM10030260 TaxID=3273390 RepID=UPI0036160669
MGWLGNIAAAGRIRLAHYGAALSAGTALAGPFLGGLTGGAAGKARLAAALATPEGQRQAFALQRALLPTALKPGQDIAAYANTGTAIVTRHADVIEVLENEADFAVVYEPRMRRLTDGENFFLGMQDGAAYTRDVTNMRAAVRRGDLAGMVVPLAARRAAEIVAAAPGRLDVPLELARRIPLHLLDRYFGTPGPSEAVMAEWTTVLFWYLFADLDGDPKIEAQAMTAAAGLRAWMDGAIAARKAAGSGGDDILGRCLALQAAGQPGMDDLGIRNNLIGLVIGFVPTIAKATTQALAQLLQRPAALATAQAAVRAGDDALLAACVFEAMRFDPGNPMIYRRAVRDTTVARGTLRALHIPEGTMVLAANLSAMFDPLAWAAPEEFRTDRPWAQYILWGWGMHTCFGEHINRAVIPQILKPLLARPGLRQVAPIEKGGTPFPIGYPVAWNAG